MLCEMFPIRSDQAADKLVMVSKTFQQSAWHRMEVSEIDQRLGEPRARLVGGKEIPAVDLSPADIVANELLLDSAALHEFSRVMDHGHDGPNGFFIRQVARLRQDDDTTLNAMRLITLGNLANVIGPEDQRQASRMSPCDKRTCPCSEGSPWAVLYIDMASLAGVEGRLPRFLRQGRAGDFPAGTWEYNGGIGGLRDFKGDFKGDIGKYWRRLSRLLKTVASTELTQTSHIQPRFGDVPFYAPAESWPGSGGCAIGRTAGRVVETDQARRYVDARKSVVRSLFRHDGRRPRF
jgi:hypothetical protein